MEIVPSRFTRRSAAGRTGEPDGPAEAPNSTPVAATAAGTGPRRYWHALDGLRGVAVMAVVLYHLDFPGSSGGWLGVDVFFVLSGFVVTNNLRQQSRDGSGYGRFLMRRAARLYPALLVLVAVLVAWSVATDGTLRAAVAGAALSAILQVYNLTLDPLQLDGRGFIPLWSLGIEWQFYLVAPLLVARLCRLRNRPAAGVAAALAGLVMIARPLTQLMGVSPGDQYLATWFRLDGLLLGVCASFLYRDLSAPSIPRLRRASVAGTATMLGCLVLWPGWYVSQRPSLIAAIPIVGIATFALVLAIGADIAPPRIVALLELRPLVWIGERAYSIYLWNYFVGTNLFGGDREGWPGPGGFGLRLVLTIAIADASYRFVERPSREYLNRRISSRNAVQTTK